MLSHQLTKSLIVADKPHDTTAACFFKTVHLVINTMEKLEWWRIPNVWRQSKYCFDTITACDRQTDRQTDRDHSHDMQSVTTAEQCRPTLVRDWTGSLHSKHFFTLGEQREHVATCPHGPNKVSRFVSEQTMQSSNDSCSEWTRPPTPALAPLHHINTSIWQLLRKQTDNIHVWWVLWRGYKTCWPIVALWR